MMRILIAGAVAATLALTSRFASRTRRFLEALRGTSEGLWDLPMNGRRGHASGKLLSPGQPALAMKVRLEPPVARNGDMVGLMEGVLVGAGSRQVARIRGRYCMGALGNHCFEAGFLPPSGGGDWNDLGRIYGAFHDDQGRSGTPGRYVARWTLRR